MAKLDHLMFACCDLTLGISEIADLTGVEPAVGGAHPGMGTCNALLSLGTDQYLEIIAPDPEQEIKGTLGAELIDHGGSGLRAWAVAATDLDRLRQIAIERGLKTNALVDMNRTTPQGIRLDWQIMFVGGYALLPFFIDWKASPHPALNTPTGCTLSEFCITTSDCDRYRADMSALDISVTVVKGENSLSAVLQTPSGETSLGSW